MSQSNFPFARRTLISISAAAALVVTAGAQAAILDIKIGEANLANSADATEKAKLAEILGVAPDALVLDFKLANNAGAFNVVADSVPGQWVIDVAPNEPGYFLLKFGTGGTGATADTFFFQNIGELSKLVFSNEQVQHLSGGNCGANNNNACNIGRLSHYTVFSGGGTPPSQIPEPGVLLLLGVGLAGLGLTRRRARR